MATYEKTMDPFDRAFPQDSRVALPAGSRVTSRLGLFRVEARVIPPKPERKQMTAVVIRRFGGPDVLHVESIPRPVAGPGQLLIRVRAVAVNPLDAKMRAGAVRELYPAWFPDVLGYNLAGVVEDVGEGVPQTRIGEEVFGASPPWARSGYAEYAVVDAAAFFEKPTALDFATASTVCSALATADNALFALGLACGQATLIHGGSGAVGSFAVQLAKRAGARVIATASGRNVQRVGDLGADVVVDYKKDRFEDHARDVDVVLDTVGGATRERSLVLLPRGGVLVTLVPPMPDPRFCSRARHPCRLQPRAGAHRTQQHGHARGAVRFRWPETSCDCRGAPLTQALRAHALVESGHTDGRVLLEA